jgi:hypothetical protein
MSSTVAARKTRGKEKMAIDARSRKKVAPFS